MLRHLRSAMFWLALAALSLQGMAGMDVGWPAGAATPQQMVAVGTPAMSGDAPAGMQMGAPTGKDSPGCPSTDGCIDPMTGHCLATPGCTPLFLGDLGTSAVFDTRKAAPPAIAPSVQDAWFLTGAPDRPPRQLA